jgi:hypothetical protein
MSSSVVVSYTLKPETVAEHLELVAAVFAELQSVTPPVDYRVLRMADGVSFVHVSTAHTEDGSNPIPTLASFQRFSAGLGARCSTPPVAVVGDVVGLFPA